MYKSDKKPMKKKSVKKSATLTQSQKDRLMKHKVHHTPKHMAMMRRDMRAGMSFTAAHKKAQKMVGK